MARELFWLEINGEKHAICCNPGERFHGWLFKLVDNRWVSQHRLKVVWPANVDDRMFGEGDEKQ